MDKMVLLVYGKSQFEYTGCNAHVTVKQLREYLNFHHIPVKSNFRKNQLCDLVDKMIQQTSQKGKNTPKSFFKQDDRTKSSPTSIANIVGQRNLLQSHVQTLKGNTSKSVKRNDVNGIHLVIDPPLTHYYNVPGDSWQAFQKNLDQAKLDSSNEFSGFNQYYCRHFTKNHTIYFKVSFLIEMPRGEIQDKKISDWIKNLHCHEMGHYETIKQKMLDFCHQLQKELPKTIDIIQVKIDNLFQEFKLANVLFDATTNHGCSHNSACPTISPCL